MITTRGVSNDISAISAKAHSIPMLKKVFGMHSNTHIEPPLIDSSYYGSVRMHDYTSGGHFLNWRDTETSKGVFDWQYADTWVNVHAAAGRDIVWTFVAPPDWAVAASAVGGAAYGGKSNMPPDSNTDWTDYITATMTRYSGAVKYWQCWNEPNLALYWSGAAATSARLAGLQRLLYQTAKALDPSCTVLSAPFTSVFGGIAGLIAFLAASDGASGTGKDWFDVLAYHFYCNDNSRMGIQLERLHSGITAAMTAAGISKPIWATETGLINPALLTYGMADQKQFVIGYLMTLLALGVERVFWYSSDNATIGLSTNGSAAWSEIVAQLLGKTTRGGTIVVADQKIMTSSLNFTDNTSIGASIALR